MLQLGEQIADRRPEVDLPGRAGLPRGFTSRQLPRPVPAIFQRRDLLELHLTIACRVGERYRMPSSRALLGYSASRRGVFSTHADLPGASRWSPRPGSHQMMRLLRLKFSWPRRRHLVAGLTWPRPVGPGSRRHSTGRRASVPSQTFFVTNGTSTANKIVVQSIITPRDVVLFLRTGLSQYPPLRPRVLGAPGDLPGLSTSAGPVLRCTGCPCDYHPMLREYRQRRTLDQVKICP